MGAIKSLLAAAALLGSLTVATPAEAALQYLGTFGGNDCKGSFSNCFATQGGVVQGPLGTGVMGSPVIAKYNGNGTLDEVSSLFPSINGSEISISLDKATDVLSFLYNPGASDPAIRYFSIKQGNQYALFFDSSSILSASIDLDTYFKGSGYSHVTFYDTAAAVPEPGTWTLMLLGFGFIGSQVRRQRRRNVMPQLA